MRELTEFQKEFILYNFFKDERYAGWKDIADCLLESGSCVVAGDECIWRGGIGNFIETKKAKGFVGCTEYIFNLEEFLSSAWYTHTANEYKKNLYDEKIKVEKKYNDISAITPA